MAKNLAILILFVFFISPGRLSAQGKSKFSGDAEKYREEISAFMGPNLNPEQRAVLNDFLNKWDSTSFTNDIKTRIIEISGQMATRLMRPAPHFIEYFRSINSFISYNRTSKDLSDWLKGLNKLLPDRKTENERINVFIKNTALMIKSGILYESGSMKWKVKDSPLKFNFDTVFYISVSNATLTCIAQKDSTEIYKATGIYFPHLLQFKGSKGVVTWEKAGFAASDVFAEMDEYTIATNKSSFTDDSARLVHNKYFREPVSGELSDQVVFISAKERAAFPRFETFTKKFKIKDLYESVDYEGGLSFEGATAKGKGENIAPAKISLFRNDTLYVKIRAKEFVFSKGGLNSSETSVTLYLDKDSIYHSNLGFSFFSANRQVNLFRTNNPVSKSPYYNSYHSIDMYFDYLTWNMNESNIIMSRSKGAAMGQALFESSSYFNSGYFMRLMGIDQYHPLNRLIKFSEYYYSETFPVVEFAKWLNRPQDAVTGLCIDMANKGFVFYDRTNNEVTIKKKTKDFLDAFAKKKDYDVLSILSETAAPEDNAFLNLNNYDLTVNGVKEVFLSDSQKVAIYPENKQIIIRKNRKMEFNGIIDCGLFKTFGHEFTFDYNSFTIDLRKIDSIKIAVETDVRDLFGKPEVRDVASLIQLGSAELFIDHPDNKSGLKSLKQYPIINARTYSYIFYDRIPGLEGIYKPEDFYFKVDPFIYENIDHYQMNDMKLPGDFMGGTILKPMRQNLEIQKNFSLGFNMVIPKEGIEIYEERAVLYDSLHMSNQGLVANGRMKHLTSTTLAGEFKLFPDSMLTHSESFFTEKDTTGKYPVLTSEDANIRWLTRSDEWLATNAKGKSFNMFENGTTLDGLINLTPDVMKGKGVINMTNSRITSDLFNFSSNEIKADTADYNLKSATTNGYSFIAENANTNINFDKKLTTFHLNTDSSVVKFPEIQYFCTMTDFSYDMDKRILSMEQKGKSNSPLLAAENLLKLDLKSLDKPTFFATNSIRDTISFSSWKGTYHLDQEYIEAENINYIHIADALIQPDSGKLIIRRRAQIQQMQNAKIAINNRHILHSARVTIESPKRYGGSGIYDYLAEERELQQINFTEITVDTLTTTARGNIPVGQNFMLSSAFSFSGDVTLSARSDNMTFNGIAGISHNCSSIKSYAMKFKSPVDPKRIMIPVGDKTRDLNDNLVFSGSYMTNDSIHIYPAFLSAQKSWTDIPVVSAKGFLYYDKGKSQYLISSLEKLADPKLPGNLISFDNNYCLIAGEGTLNLGAKLDLVKLNTAGKLTQSADSGKVAIETVIGLDFFFSPDALKLMAEEFRMMPTLRPVNLSSETINKGMKDLLGTTVAAQVKDEMDLFGTSRSLPKDFPYELVLNDVKLTWNESTSSFRSSGKIGIGFVGPQPINVYVDGSIEIQRRRTGDLVDIYLKADATSWYYFSYFRGVMMTQAGNAEYNTVINKVKVNNRKDPQSTARVEYSYMIAPENRLRSFLRRMESDEGAESVPVN
jgi:hypothetical protein